MLGRIRQRDQSSQHITDCYSGTMTTLCLVNRTLKLVSKTDKFPNQMRDYQLPNKSAPWS